jgi:hypothetical protein
VESEALESRVRNLAQRTCQEDGKARPLLAMVGESLE